MYSAHQQIAIDALIRYCTPFFVSAISIFIVFIVTCRRLNARGAWYLALVCLSAAFWSASEGLLYTPLDFEVKVFLTKLQYFGIVPIPPLALLCVLSIFGFTSWTAGVKRFLLFLPGAIIIVMVWTNPLHQLFFTDFFPILTGPVPMLGVGHGILWWLTSVYLYVLITVLSVVLLYRVATTSGFPRAQAGVILVAVFSVWAANAVYVSGNSPVPNMDISPIAFSLVAGSMAWGFFRYNLLEILPVARAEIVRGLDDAILVFNEKGALIDTNPAAESVFEVEVSKNIGQAAQLVFSSYPEFLEILDTMQPTEIHLVKDAHDHIYDVRVSFLSGSSGSKIGKVITLRDITDRKRAEKTMLESDARYRQIFNIAPAGIYEVDYRTGKLVNVNDSICAYTGYTRDELLSMNALEMLTKASQTRFLKRLDKISKGEHVPETVEFSVLRKDGTELMASINLSFVYEGQEIVGATAVAQDISERKQTEAVLHLQHDLGIALSGAINLEEALTLIVDAACKLPDMDCGGVYLVNQDTHALDLLYSNGLSPQFVEKISYYGKDSDQAKIINSGKAIFADYAQLKISRDPVKQKEKVRAIAILPISHTGKAIGALNVASHSINSIPLQTRQYLETIASQVGSAIARVIAEEKKFQQNRELKLLSIQLHKEIDRHKLTEKTLKLEKERLRILTENSPFGISLIGADGRYLYLNPKFIEIFGYELADIPTGEKWFQKAFPDRAYRDQIISAWIEDQKTFGVGETRPRTFTAISKDSVEKLIHFRPVALESKQQLVFYEDITDKKQLESQLQRAQRMEAIGTLAGGVAHDLNNILSAQVSYPDLILMDLPEDSPLREPLLTIQKSGKKAAAIVQDLLTLARRGVVATEAVSLNDIIQDYIKSPECENLLAFHPGVRVTCDLEPGLPNMMGSSFHLATTVANMCSNAAEAMPRGGNISIATHNEYMDVPVRGYEAIKEGDYVVLTVSDRGAGISSEDLEKIFEPFYTKKVMGRSGTGLGMAVVWGTVKDHGGYIEVQSTEGVGTTFKLYFSVTRKAISGKKEDLSMATYMGKGESILVVDDVAAQREIAFRILTKLNYTVTSVSSGEEAVDYLKNNSVDLLLLDMIMDPGMDGLATFRRILKLHPGQKAIIASGFSETDTVQKAQKLGAGTYLKKPYTLEKIGLAIKAEFEK